VSQLVTSVTVEGNGHLGAGTEARA
jgi:hypothetical protein